MKFKTLIPFVVVLAILGGLVFVRNAQKKPASIAEQSGIQSVAPDNVSPESIRRIELHTGDAPDEKLVLAREGDEWVAASSFNAPVKKDTVDDYLKKLTNIRGESRTTAPNDDALDAYKLKDGDAFHVKAYTGGEEPAIHLLFGKAPDFRSVFFRKAGDMTVYVEANDLRREAGVMGDDMTIKPTADRWLNKDIAKVDDTTVTRLALTMPDKTLTLEQREVPAEAPAGEEQKEGEAEATPPATKKEWFASAGALGETIKQEGVTRLLGRFKNLAASNLLDPATKADHGLDNPPFRIAISREGESDLVLLGAHKDPAGPGHLMIEGADREVIYEVSKFNFENIFIKGSELYDLPKLAIQQDQVTRVELTSPEGNAVFVKNGDDWTAEQPTLDFPLDQDKVKTLVSTAVGLQMRDYADSNQPYTHSVTLHAGDTTRTVQGGGATPGFEGAYAAVDTDTRTYAVNKTEAEAIFLAPKDLFTLKPFDVQAGDISTVGIVQDGKRVQATLAETGWTVAVDGAEAFTADKTRVDDIAIMLQDFTFANIHGGGRTAGWQPLLTVEFTTKGGESHKLNISPLEGEVHLVQLDDNPTIFEIDTDNVNTIRYHYNSIQTRPDSEEAPAEAPAAEEPAADGAPGEASGEAPGEASAEAAPAAEESGDTPAEVISLPAE